MPPRFQRPGSRAPEAHRLDQVEEAGGGLQQQRMNYTPLEAMAFKPEPMALELGGALGGFDPTAYMPSQNGKFSLANHDGWQWRKYGEKTVRGNPHPRSYYKCSNVGCAAKKVVERDDEGDILNTEYKGSHSHPAPLGVRTNNNHLPRPRVVRKIQPPVPSAWQPEAEQWTGALQAPLEPLQRGAAMAQQPYDSGMRLRARALPHRPSALMARPNTDEAWGEEDEDEEDDDEADDDPETQAARLVGRLRRGAAHTSGSAAGSLRGGRDNTQELISPAKRLDVLAAYAEQLQEEDEQEQEDEAPHAPAPVPAAPRGGRASLRVKRPRAREASPPSSVGAGSVDEGGPYSGSAGVAPDSVHRVYAVQYDDGYRWRKYGQKVVKGSTHPRSYFKCTVPNCPVRKHVERMADESGRSIITYEHHHTHLPASSPLSIHWPAGLPAGVRVVGGASEDEGSCLEGRGSRAPVSPADLSRNASPAPTPYLATNMHNMQRAATLLLPYLPPNMPLGREGVAVSPAMAANLQSALGSLGLPGAMDVDMLVHMMRQQVPGPQGAKPGPADDDASNSAWPTTRPRHDHATTYDPAATTGDASYSAWGSFRQDGNGAAAGGAMGTDAPHSAWRPAAQYESGATGDASNSAWHPLRPDSQAPSARDDVSNCAWDPTQLMTQRLMAACNALSPQQQQPLLRGGVGGGSAAAAANGAVPSPLPRGSGGFGPPTRRRPQ